ncbi:EpsG family protein [Amedibacillus dolichus]|uniref:EpsG family protein n=1 Tax=Amedibacillus dolichus TaxID=31971 RepID=UPI00399F4419
MSELFYIVAMLIALAMAYLANRTKKKSYLWLLIILLTILSGFRARTVGVDTLSYYSDIECGFPYDWRFEEEGFRFIANIIMDYTHNPQWLFVFCAFITNSFILVRLWDFKNEARFDFMVFLYLCIFYGNTMNIMRQAMAVALVFYGTRYLKENKYHKFLLFLLIAFTFHRTALLSIAYILINLWFSMSKNQKKIFAIPFICVIIGSVLYVARYLVNDIDAYSSQTISNINVVFFYRLFVTIATILFNKLNIKVIISQNHRTMSNKYTFDKSLVTYVLIGLSFEALSMFFSFVGRTGLYYLMFEPVFWGTAIKQTKNRKIYGVLIAIFAIYMFYLLVFTNSANLFPYSIYLN